MRVLCEFADTWQIRTPHTCWIFLMCPFGLCVRAYTCCLLGDRLSLKSYKNGVVGVLAPQQQQRRHRRHRNKTSTPVTAAALAESPSHPPPPNKGPRRTHKPHDTLNIVPNRYRDTRLADHSGAWVSEPTSDRYKRNTSSQAHSRGLSCLFRFLAPRARTNVNHVPRPQSELGLAGPPPSCCRRPPGRGPAPRTRPGPPRASAAAPWPATAPTGR